MIKIKWLLWCCHHVFHLAHLPFFHSCALLFLPKVCCRLCDFGNPVRSLQIKLCKISCILIHRLHPLKAECFTMAWQILFYNSKTPSNAASKCVFPANTDLWPTRVWNTPCFQKPILGRMHYYIKALRS